MAEVIKATLEQFDRIYPLLEHFEIAGMDSEAWRMLLGQRWSERYDHFGYALVDSGRYVGFLGTFFRDVELNNSPHTICNLFCWYVMEEYRQQSLLLMLAVLREPDLTITSLTPSEEASLVLKQFRFSMLEDSVFVVPLTPVPSLSRGYRIVHSRKEMAELLADEERLLLERLGDAWCSHLVVQDVRNPDDYSYVVFNRVRKRGVPFTQVYHVSNVKIFRKNLVRLGWTFFRLNHTMLTVTDMRLAGGALPFPALSYRLRYPRLFRSDVLKPGDIDNLFTEMMFLRAV